MEYPCQRGSFRKSLALICLAQHSAWEGGGQPGASATFFDGRALALDLRHSGWPPGPSVCPNYFVMYTVGGAEGKTEISGSGVPPTKTF